MRKNIGPVAIPAPVAHMHGPKRFARPPARGRKYGATCPSPHQSEPVGRPLWAYREPLQRNCFRPPTTAIQSTDVHRIDEMSVIEGPGSGDLQPLTETRKRRTRQTPRTPFTANAPIPPAGNRIRLDTALVRHSGAVGEHRDFLRCPCREPWAGMGVSFVSATQQAPTAPPRTTSRWGGGHVGDRETRA